MSGIWAPVPPEDYHPHRPSMLNIWGKRPGMAPGDCSPTHLKIPQFFVEVGAQISTSVRRICQYHRIEANLAT
jgi:hypothetical protein